MPTHTFIIYNSISQTEGLALGVDKMKKTKKAVSLILAFAMVLSAMLGCMTVSSFATEGRAEEGTGPKLVDYSISVANTDPKTEAGSEILINLMFDKAMGSTNYTKSAFDISINNRSLADMGFAISEVKPSGTELIIDLKGIDKGDDSWAYVVSGKLDVSLKSNYYEDIVDADGNEVSEWTDIHTYVQTGLEFEKQSSVNGDINTPASVTFQLTGDAKLRGASPVQILVNGESIVCTEVKPGEGEDGGDLTLGGDCNESRGTVNVHTHMYLSGTNEKWASLLAGNFYSKEYDMTAEGDTVTITAKQNGENTDLAENTVMRAFGYSEGDAVVQPVLFREELSAAKERAAEIEESNSVAQECKDTLNTAIAQAELVEPDTVQSGVKWQTIRADLQSAVDGAQDNAITTTSVTRSNGSVSLSLLGGQDWIDQVESVKLNDKVLEKDTDYSFDSGMLKIKSLVFDTPGQTTAKTTNYTVTIESKGYATVTQEVTVTYNGSASFTVRLLDKDGNVRKSKTFTEAEIRAFSENPETGGKGVMYSTACSMTGSRAFKGDGAYLSALIADAGFVEGKDFNPETTKAKFRTNDSNDETDLNDDPSVDSYFNMITTDYTELMADRYYFQDLYNHETELWKTYKAGEEVDQNNSAAVAEHNLKLRKAMADSNKVLVKNMIAYQFVEDPNVDFDDEPLTNVPYDENLKADKCFRFLLGTSMVEENGETLSSTLNTTMRATYQLYGIDLVDSSYSDDENAKDVEFDVTPESAEIDITDSHGASIYPVEGKYPLINGEIYNYTISAPGYITETGTYEVTDEAVQTVEVSLSRESSGGGGGGSAVAKDYTVTFDSNGGSDVAKQTVTSGEKVNKPADPTREGYEFAGWYTDSKLTTAYDFSSKVTKSITLYAKWTEKGAEPEPSTSFKDVAADAWYAEYVSYLAGKGIVNGKTADTFAPDAQITRAEFIKIIAGVAGADVSGKSSSRFSDVASDAWYAPYVAWGVENGIINGTSETTFHPNGNISRQDMATMIKRYTDFAKFTLPADTKAVNFTDSAQISSYAADAVKAMQQAGIINGKGGNTFAPKDNATRAEACKMLTVLMKMMEA